MVSANFGKMCRRLLPRVAGPLVGLVLLAVSVYGLDWAQLGVALGRARAGYVLAALLSVMLTILAKAARWRALFGLDSSISLDCCVAGVVIGQMVNAVLPGRVGDLARIGMLGREKGLGYPLTIGTLIAEKALDGLMLLVLMVVVVPFVPAANWLDTSSAIVGVTLSASLFLLTLLILRWHPFRQGLTKMVVRVAGRRAARWAEPIELALKSLSAASPLHWQPWLWTAGIWLLGACTNQLTFLALKLDVTWGAAVFLLAVLLLGGFVRFIPAQIGLFEYLTILALGAYGVEREAGLACGLLLHVVVIGPPLVWGIWALRKEGFYWTELIHIAARRISDG